jgi:low affinity Fe/Cu permease
MPGLNSSLDIIVPTLMCAALLWWIGRGMSTRSMLIATAVTLAVIAAVLLVQNAGWR